MNSKKKRRGQMSEALCTAMFLSLSGGLQDVYTYLFRGKVFANAQTGNIVLMAVHAFAGEWGRVLHYLVPLCFFALGVFAAELMHQKLQNLQRLHWRQLVVLGEVLLLFAVGFLPQSQNLLANAIVSFSCAMQVQAFRKVHGYPFASTMCIGNLRSGMDAMKLSTKPLNPFETARPLEEYKLVIVGSPVWAGRCASPIRALLKRRGLEMENVAYVVTRSTTQRSEEVYDQMDMYTGQAHRLAVSLRPDSEGYEFWRNDFIQNVRRLLEND